MHVFSVKEDVVAIECEHCKKIYNFSRSYFSNITKESCTPNVNIVCPNCKNSSPAGTPIHGKTVYPSYQSEKVNPTVSEKKPGSGCLIGIVIVVILMLLLAIGGSFESDYERAGKEFDDWINDDPRTWTDTEKQYFDDFMDWANDN